MTLRHFKSLGWFAAIGCLLAVGSVRGEDETPPPKFAAVAQAALSSFNSLPGYEPGDLVSQSQVEGALNAVEQVGWDVPDRKNIVDLALADNAWLVRELSTKKGQSFMRKVARFPGGYLRLDRLSSIADGKAAVRVLIKDPGGDEMIQYMDTTQGGFELGRMMGGAKGGVDLNKPSGRIYTADDLVAVLQNLYARQFP
jgi:hypothetical protein